MYRPLLYLWAAPASLVGLFFVMLGVASGGRIQIVQGVLEVHGGIVTTFLRRGMPWMASGAAAMTLGHVVLGCDRHCLERTRAHEHVHVRQYERFGPLFIPLYLWYSWRAYRQGLDPYLDNPFEVEAYEQG